MVYPDDDSLALAFDRVLQEFRRVESIASHLGIPWLGASRWIEPPASHTEDRQTTPCEEAAHVFVGAQFGSRRASERLWPSEVRFEREAQGHTQ